MSEVKYIFVIDTREYAGNFERELCAHCTGITGECEVGDEFAKNFHIEEPTCELFQEVESRPDDHGCARPTSLWDGPNGQAESVAIFFLEKPSDKEIELIKRRAMTFNETCKNIYWNKQTITVTGFRILKETTILEEV